VFKPNLEKSGKIPISISTGTTFAGGLAAGAIAIAIELIIRSFTGGIFVPELASQTLFSLTPGQFESQEQLLLILYCTGYLHCWLPDYKIDSLGRAL
jgi:hypothetical protein